VIASPAIVFAQDFFLSFDSTSAQTTTTQEVGTSGTAYLFSQGLFSFDAADVDFTSSNSSVLLFNGGEVFNNVFSGVGGMRFDTADITIDPAGDSGNFFVVNVIQNGINPTLGPLFDPDFDANVGPNGAFLLASIDYSVVGPGTATLDLTVGPQGVLQLPGILNPIFGSSTLTAVAAAVPEPSSAALLVLGSVGFVARRRKV